MDDHKNSLGDKKQRTNRSGNEPNHRNFSNNGNKPPQLPTRSEGITPSQKKGKQ